MVPEVCEAITKVLAPIYLKFPNKDDFLMISKEFQEKFDFSHCLGAIDGTLLIKH